MSNLKSSSAHGRKPATLDDVAALAEVSPKTVSRVVNSEGGVHSATRERVRRAIELLDYKPNLNARVLAGDRSYTIGLFCERPGDYLSAFQASATDRCRESGYHLIVEEWNRANPNAVRHVTALLRQLRPDGAILLPPLSDDRLIYNTLLDASIPIVRIAPREQSTDSPSIGIDDYLAARQLAAHLLGLGHLPTSCVTRARRSRRRSLKPVTLRLRTESAARSACCAHRPHRRPSLPATMTWPLPRSQSRIEWVSIFRAICRSLGSMTLPSQP